jgi:hypothetical protein
MVRLAPLALLPGDQAPEVAGRPVVTRGDGDGQQPLRGDPPVGLGDPLSNDIADVVVVVDHLDRDGVVLLSVSEHGSLDGLVGGAADVRGASIGADLAVGGKDVHAFPRCDH